MEGPNLIPDEVIVKIMDFNLLFGYSNNFFISPIAGILSSE
jgi:hypothetical protein